MYHIYYCTGLVYTIVKHFFRWKPMEATWIQEEFNKLTRETWLQVGDGWRSGISFQWQGVLPDAGHIEV